MHLKIHTPPVVYFSKIFHRGCMEQWRNRRGGVPPETCDREISADVSGKKRQGKIGNREERKKIVKGKVENWKWKEGKVPNWGEDFFFFFAFHFSKRWKFVSGVPKWKFSTGKKNFTRKKIRKKDFATSEKNFLLRPWYGVAQFCYGYSIAILITYPKGYTRYLIRY